MYTVTGPDRVVKLTNMPDSNVGTPEPELYSTEHAVYLAYYLEDQPDTGTDRYALVKFIGPFAHYFGMPNDEALSGHPLFARGLENYMQGEVLNSSWIRVLERMNSVHDQHGPEAFDSLHHYIFAFHDSTFECVANGYEVSISEDPDCLKSLIQSL